MFHIWREGTGQCANLKQFFCLFALHRCTVQKSVTSGTCLQALSCFAEVNIANESTKKRKRIDGEGPFARVTISVFRCLLSQIFPPPPPTPILCRGLCEERIRPQLPGARFLFVVRISRCVWSRLSPGTACERA